ncbi:1%2C5-anhydro-D-fructose reductase [uncultured Clostridium sp.]|nr:1%2C5-anhydro-D-fructose reductase [uncultured Clostridium sp.]
MLKPWKPVKVALIGAGVISGEYLKNMVYNFDILDVVGCSDIIPEKSAARAAEFGIRQMTNEEILSDPEIEVVVNTTYPTEHYNVSKQILEAGKHLYCEKPMCAELGQAKELMDLAREKGLYIGNAPDTFLGAGYQTARHLLDAGIIGKPIMARATLIRGSYVLGGADPKFPFPSYPGGGIIFDVGCYYLVNLINLLGPIRRVAGFAQTNIKEKPYVNPHHPEYGDQVKTQSPTNTIGALEFESGVLGTIMTTTECFSETPQLEIYGSEGILTCPDPNCFGGDVKVTRVGYREPYVVQHTHAYTDPNMRGIGVAEFAYAIRNGRKARTDASMAYHFLEASFGMIESGETERYYHLQSTCERPAALASGITTGYTEYVLNHE